VKLLEQTIQIDVKVQLESRVERITTSHTDFVPAVLISFRDGKFDCYTLLNIEKATDRERIRLLAEVETIISALEKQANRAEHALFEV
jgi:hypothetical protein